MSQARIGLLTGPVGVGKTTIAKRVAGLARRQGLASGGLLAPALLNSYGQKTGIWAVDASTGNRRILARTDRDLGGPTIGPYSFDHSALAWACDLVEQAIEASDLLIVDEIGKLELWQDTGLAPILPRLASGQAKRSLVLVRESLLAELQQRLAPINQVVFRANEDNRGELPHRILEQLADSQPA